MRQHPYDLLIRGGSVIDGTGVPAEIADVAVDGGRIAAIGLDLGPSRQTLDASGLIVAPGFIDVHSHDDAVALTSPSMDFKVMQGVTTDIVGNCGAGIAPVNGSFRAFIEAGVGNVLGPPPEIGWRTFAEYMQAVQSAHPALNVAFLIPHGALRFGALGLEQRSPSDVELASMREQVREGMGAGALGLSTGLIYPPGTFADTPELIDLAGAAAAFGGLYVSHIRDEGPALLDAVNEAIDIGGRAGCPVQISHHKAAGRENWGRTSESIGLIEKACSEGQDVTFDAYPYTASSTIFGALARRPEGADPDAVRIVSSRHHPEFDGKTVTQIAEMLGLSPADAGDQLLRDEYGAVAVFFAMSEEDVRRVLRHELCMIGSDGLPSARGKPHPRLYGTFPRVLGHYVRDEELMTLEEAVYKMTVHPARRFQLTDRGELATDMAADVVVFDPALVADTATYEEPRQYPKGIEYVIINGEIVVRKGVQTKARPGRVLRRVSGG